MGLTESTSYEQFPMIDDDKEIMLAMVLQNGEHN